MEFEAIEWLYKRFVRLNVKFPWSKNSLFLFSKYKRKQFSIDLVGQQLDKTSFPISFAFQLVAIN